MAIRPRIQRCFVDWLDAARPRLAVQPRVTERNDHLLRMTFEGLTPMVGANLSRYDIDVWVVWEDGTCWDLVYSEYIEVAGRRGAHVCKACPPDARTVYASREALWRDHLFELFLSWINNTLASASAMALYKSGLGSTSATLLREGKVLGNGPPNIVIAAAGRPAAAMTCLHPQDTGLSFAVRVTLRDACPAGAYRLRSARRVPDGRRLAQRFSCLGFTHGITTGIAKPASVRDQSLALLGRRVAGRHRHLPRRPCRSRPAQRGVLRGGGNGVRRS